MTTQTRNDPTRIPGEGDIWVLIFGDMLIFTLFFVSFVYYRGQARPIFSQSQDMLSLGFGLTNTVLLLTSSLFVALGVEMVRFGKHQAPVMFAGAMVCGGSFTLVKILEYREKILQGIMPTTNEFFTLYFAFTGIHLVHVLLGLAVLGFLVIRSRQPVNSQSEMALIERGAIFWHLVDMLWIILFSLLYLLR